MTRAARSSTAPCAPNETWLELIARAWVPDGWQPRLWGLRCRYMAEACRDAERAAEWLGLAEAVRAKWQPIEQGATEYERIIQGAFFSER